MSLSDNLRRLARERIPIGAGEVARSYHSYDSALTRNKGLRVGSFLERFLDRKDQLNAHHTIAAATTSAATIMMNALNLFIGFSLYFLPTDLLRPPSAVRVAAPTNPTALT